MVKVAALHDIYEVIATCSGKLQDLQTFPWDRTKAFDNLIEDLEEMEAQIDEEMGLDPDSPLWKRLRSRPDCSKQVISAY